MSTASSSGYLSWLQDYRSLTDALEFYKWRKRKVAAEIERLAAGDLRNAAGPNSHNARAEEEEAACTRAIRSIEGELSELMEIVDSFDGIDNQILKLKYIEGMNLEQIAEALDYSDDTIKKRHASLRRTLKFLDHWNDHTNALMNRKDYATNLDGDFATGRRSY